MNKRMVALLAGAAVATALSAGVANAQVSPGNPGKDGEASRDLALGADLAKRKVTAIAPVKVEEQSRDLGGPDEGAMVEGFTTISRSFGDGKETKTPASEEMRGLIIESLKGGNGEAPSGVKDEEGVDPNRQVFGDDDRVQITETSKFPFRVIGQLWTKVDDENWGSCSATLIGPSTIITAAHCIYSHDHGGWGQAAEFYPGLDGENAPFGVANVTNANILEGFVSQYKDNYGSVVAYDLAVLELDAKMGDELGWMSFGSFAKPASFTANIVGYPGDKPASTMWRASCDVNEQDFNETNFAYLCDTYPGSSGSSVYLYNKDKKERVILGVNIAENPQFNLATRLNAAYFKWVKDLAK